MIKLSEILITEIGEGSQPYSYTKAADTEDMIAYAFKGKYEDPYVVKFKAKKTEPGVYVLSFYPGTSLSSDAENEKIDTITNRGDALKIISTVVAITKEVITNNQDRITGINWIGIISPDKEGSEIQRDNLYAAYLKKNIASIPNWVNVSKPSSPVTKIRRKKP